MGEVEVSDEVQMLDEQMRELFLFCAYLLAEGEEQGN